MELLQDLGGALIASLASVIAVFAIYGVSYFLYHFVRIVWDERKLLWIAFKENIKKDWT